VQAVIPLFDLLAILATLVTVGTVARFGYLLLRGRRQQARRVLTRWSLGAFLYVIGALVVGAARPERSIGLGERGCFDDWCVGVNRVALRDAPPGVVYTLDLESSNEARRAEGARYPWMFVRDERGHQYLPNGSEWAAAIEAQIPAHGSKRFSVEFTVPHDARHLAFVTGHGSGRSCSLLPALLLAGDSRCLFHKYDSIRLD
jgi:hypothetical protein